MESVRRSLMGGGGGEGAGGGGGGEGEGARFLERMVGNVFTGGGEVGEEGGGGGIIGDYAVGDMNALLAQLMRREAHQTHASPASERAIASLETVVWEEVREGTDRGGGAEERECVVCQEELGDGKVLKRMPCGHVFHGECVETWLRRHANNCPICRRALEEEGEPGREGEGGGR